MNPTIESPQINERPWEVTRGVQLLYLALLIGLIRALVQVMQRASGIPAIIASLVVAAFFAVLFLLIWRIGARANWARIVSLILIGIGLPFAVLQAWALLRLNVTSGALSFLILLLQVAGTVMLFLTNSNQWFRKSK